MSSRNEHTPRKNLQRKPDIITRRSYSIVPGYGYRLVHARKLLQKYLTVMLTTLWGVLTCGELRILKKPYIKISAEKISKSFMRWKRLTPVSDQPSWFCWDWRRPNRLAHPISPIFFRSGTCPDLFCWVIVDKTNFCITVFSLTWNIFALLSTSALSDSFSGFAHAWAKFRFRQDQDAQFAKWRSTISCNTAI